MKHVDNKGFSLLELLIALTILMIMTSVIMIGIGMYRRRDAERYARALQNQIQIMQTASMTKTGTRRLALYCENKKYYCVQEVKRDGNGASEVVWEASGKETELGFDGAVHWEKKNGQSSVSGADPDLIMIWQFASDTGACVDENGNVITAAVGVTAKNGNDYMITVYGVNGYCEVDKQ
jgi:type II secretory pathway pseudopilin PulG